MDNKKGSFQNTNAPAGEPPLESIPKHQHNTAPQHLRLVQYGLKIPNHHHNINNSQSVAPNQHIHQPYQPQVQRSQLQYNNMPNIHANPLHFHYNGQFPLHNKHQQTAQQIYQSNKQALVSPSAQIWVPQRPPPHYHSKPKSETPIVPATNTANPVTPTHTKQIRESNDSAKKKIANQQLRSPSAKRSADAPVTLQGWLHKQGSDGLMLWKKRWFVLTEYCLFYYKGSEEEKLLGSILLPSYKVSICGTDDRVNKKFAFKCEHANMRTYILAADSQELLLQWVRALNLACTLQTNIESESSAVNTSPSTYDQSIENSDSGYNHHHSRNTPMHVHTSSNTTDLSNPSQEVSQYNQPLYANAPPKPRRLNDAGYSSPSPDALDKYNEPKYVTLQPPPYHQQHRNIVKSPMAIYNNLEYPSTVMMTNNNERRTPDTYGRSNIRPSVNGKNLCDYEDVYAEQYIYKRPLSPLAYNKTASPLTVIQKAYAPVPTSHQYARRPSPSSIPRPHSADFLEYEVAHRKNNNATPVNRQPRPKSSLDINRNCNNDNYFYSEERYAEKMRKSAQYLSKMPSKYLLQNSRTEQHDNTFPIIRSNTQPLGNSSYLSTPVDYARKEFSATPQLRSHSVLSEGSLQKEAEDRSRKFREPLTPNHDTSFYNYNEKEYDPFTRSASARLANIEHRLQGDGRANMNKEGERKREESMKRLLEWKQRMLQSPLNRKMNQNVSKIYYKSDGGYIRSVDSNGQPTRIPSAQYNSYSSDDEENADGRKEKESMQAGRTLETKSSETAPYASIPVLASQTDTPKHDTLSTQFDDTLTKPLQLYNKEASNIAHVSSLRSEFSQKFDQTSSSVVTVSEIKNNGALVKSILAEFEKKVLEIPSTPIPNARDVETIIEENYLPMTPKKSFRNELKIEENPYVEMTQGNAVSLLEPSATHQPYEMVSFKEGTIEPVYMELHQPQKEPILANVKSELPDILMLNQDGKSECSDADDEASKDLESLYVPNHPRFSFSDSFRPASYYLGVNQTVPEQPDSSDSELVSPPSIPRTPPLIEDLDAEKRNKLGPKNSLLSLSISYKDQDSNSICSIQTDPEISFSRMNNSDYDVDLSNSLTNSQSYERRLKRRAVSKDFGDELQSIHSDLNKITIPHSDLNKYIKELDMSNNTLQINNYPDYENMFVNATMNPGEQELFRSQEPYALGQFYADSKSHNISRSSSDGMYLPNSDVNVSYNQHQHTVAPYYYSDLSIHSSCLNDGNTMFTLNNQRGTPNNGEKRDITHIVNPIRSNNVLMRQDPLNQDQRKVNKLASDARSASADFLNIADKFGHIDKKNVYESDTLKRLKVIEPMCANTEANTRLKNIYPNEINEKFNINNASLNESGMRRSHSLEGLLENALNANESSEDHNVSEGSHIWEEDSIWRERLRNASQRHTKSLDDLDCIGQTKKKVPRGITRGAIYVNDNICNMPVQYGTVDGTGEKSQDEGRDKQSKGTESSFIIDREKLRQWDLMSSAPSESQSVSFRGNTEVDVSSGLRNRASDPESQEPASGSITLNIRDTYPRNASHNRWPSQSLQSKSTSNIKRAADGDYLISSQMDGDYYFGRAPSHHDIIAENNRKVLWKEKLNVSAGDLLGRTHEELVLLLIQLRRQSANTAHAIEAYYNEIDSIQAQLHLMDAAKRLENLQKLEQIRQHLLDLEKQYEKGKPLVNLVDNMVKLGSLYRSPNDRHNSTPQFKERLEFNQQMQEKRLLAEESRDWNRFKPNHSKLQEKVQQLYQLDRLIQEESGTLQGLQQDKEEIERALGGLRHKLMQGYNDPAIIEQARKQQSILENELSRVHLMLAQNSKKLEETVASNGRLEQELLVLKQKLQISRQNRFSPQFSNAGDSLTCVVGTSAMLESDLQKVQQSVSDLQRQRRELSMQVRQLTDRSTLSQSKSYSPVMPIITVQQPQDLKKKLTAQWRETDLDNKSEQGEHWDTTSSTTLSTTPLYIQTDLKQGTNDSSESYSRSIASDSTSEDGTNHSTMHPEKQEIKTVRIVKRESERRQRDRERNVPGKWDPLAEEDVYFQNQNSSPQKTQAVVVQKAQSSTNVNEPDADQLNRTVSSPSIPNYSEDGGLNNTDDKSPELSPVFKSEAARQIITEMSNQDIVSMRGAQQLNRRSVRIEKRRHYTAPNNNLIVKSLNQLPTEDDDTFTKALRDTRRARDDMDMERALRQRIDAPDVVRSTLSNKELKYNESTIDNLFGAPNKISIPERYVPEQVPQLSAEEQEHRLRKVESIKKMLSDTTILSSSSVNLAGSTEDSNSGEISSSSNHSSKANSKIIEEKKQREHILQLNQILAKQVMEMSKIVAARAMGKLPIQDQEASSDDDDDDDLSPETPLPLYQQRDNFYS